MPAVKTANPPAIYPVLPDRPDAAMLQRYREDGYLAFLEALTPQEVQDVLAYIRSLDGPVTIQGQ